MSPQTEAKAEGEEGGDHEGMGLETEEGQREREQRKTEIFKKIA